MAKMRVHELAKELEIKSADIVTALAEKGIEVKAASSIEDDNIVYIRTKFRKDGLVILINVVAVSLSRSSGLSISQALINAGSFTRLYCGSVLLRIFLKRGSIFSFESGI